MTSDRWLKLGSSKIKLRKAALFLNKGPYIKYVRMAAGGFHKFFKKKFVAQETIDLNISWPSNFFRKYFMASPFNFSFLSKAYLQQYFRVVLTVIFKFQITKEVNIHNNIQKKYSNKVSKKPLIFFAISKFFCNNKMKFQENSSSALQQSINWIKFIKWDWQYYSRGRSNFQEKPHCWFTRSI